MPRRSRINLADVPQHIIQRGNNRQATFFAEEDYRRYLDWLSDASKKYNCRIYAYVLMTNHVHLLASSVRPYGLSLMMQYLGRYFVRYINHALGVPDPLLAAHEEYQRLGDWHEDRQRAYRELFRTELDAEELTEIRDTANRGWPLGSDRFKDEIERALRCAARPPKRGRPPRKKTPMPFAEQRRTRYRVEKLH